MVQPQESACHKQVEKRVAPTIAEMMSHLPAEHDCVKEHDKNNYTWSIDLFLEVIFKNGQNKLKAHPETQRHPRFIARGVKFRDA